MRRALVIDSYDETRNRLVFELRREQFEAVGAPDEDDAPRESFDVIVLDVPSAELVDIAVNVRSWSTGVMLALLDPRERNVRSEARASGVDAFLLRPCAASAIVRRVLLLLPR